MTPVTRQTEDTRATTATVPSTQGLLCTANFPADTGYAWDFIEELYAGVADRLSARGVRTWVAYPAVHSPPAALEGSAAEPVALNTRLESWTAVRRAVRFVRDRNVRVVYMADRPVWQPAFAALRTAGVRRIVVHDHTSGARTPPRGAKRVLKSLVRRIPGTLADDVIAVSGFVARRKVAVDLVPPQRVRRIWNSVEAPSADAGAGERLRALLGVDADRLVVGCACRAVPEKGVAHLLRAFDRATAAGTNAPVPPVLVYFGDGPALDALAALRERLGSRDRIVLAGYRADAPELLGGADLCVVPSVWAEAFGLAALEPQVRGRPVIASEIGGLPEVVVDGETGVLVPPGDETALAAAIRRLLDDADERARLGENGRRRARAHFSRTAHIRRLTAVLERGFSHATD